MTTEGRELEARRTGASEEPAAAASVPAIYLIEREAIRLRRLRWTQLADALPPSAERAASLAAERAASPAAAPPAGLLETYARPRSEAVDSTAGRRTFAGKVKRFFGIGGKGRRP
jgi:hypothetical protein